MARYDLFILGLLFGVPFGYILRWIVRRLITGPYQKRRPSGIFSGVTFDDQNKVIGDIKEMELKEGQKVTVHVSPRSAHGHSGAIEPGSARFTSSDESVVSVEQNPDNELEAIVRGLDGSGNEPVVIGFKADGDRSEGVREIVGSLDVICTQGDAITVEMQVGPVEDDTEAGEPQPEPDTAEPAAEPVADEPAVAEDSGNAGTGSEASEADAVEAEAGDPGTATGEPIDGGSAPAEDESSPSNLPGTNGEGVV